MDTVESMRAFARVVELGGFAPAARSLGISAAMVAKHVAHLEARTGARLLDRTTRAVRPTPAGQVYAERVQAILAGIEEAESAAGADTAEARGTLRLTAPVELGAQHIAPVIAAFMLSQPGIQVVADFSNRPVDLVQEGYDLAIRVASELDTALVGRKLATTRFHVVASPGCLAREGTPDRPEALAGLPCLSFAVPAPRLEWGEAGARVRIAPRLLSSSAEALRVAALAGLGFAWLPSFVCGADIAAGRLVPVLAGHAWGSLGVHALYPHRRLLPSRLRLFLDLLIAKFGREPEGDPWAPA